MEEDLFLETFNLKSLEKIVLKCLKRNPRARKDDFILYGSVLKELGVGFETTIFQYLATAKEKKMPPFESVSRCRRHIQELMPELKDQKTAVKREEKIEDYKSYNISGIGE